MKPHIADESVTLWHGDCLDVLRELADASVDSIVTDPPYGLGFMGKAWDDLPPGVEWAAECLRVLKPGGHLLAFGGSRTWHRLAAAVEDAGFEIRDSIAWLYGSGFPKSLDVSKAIDKQRTEDLAPAAAVAKWLVDHMELLGITRRDICDHFSAENIAQQWTTHWLDGAVKPRVPRWEQWQELRAWMDLPADMDAEVWRLNGRKGKPGDNFEGREVLSERTTSREDIGWAKEAGSGMFQPGDRTIRETAPVTPAAEQWQGWGTALKPAFEPVVVGRKPLVGTVAANVLAHGTGALNIDGCRIGETVETWPASRRQYASTGMQPGGGVDGATHSTGAAPAGRWPANVVLDESQAGLFEESRFMYVAKAPKSERPRTDDGTAHPTVKPLALMRWLVRLVTPPGGVVLEPFAGSGTTVEACLLEGFQCIAIEREADYLPLIEARIARVAARPTPDLGLLAFLDGESA